MSYARLMLGWMTVVVTVSALATAAALAAPEAAPETSAEKIDAAAPAAGGDDPNMLAYNNHCRTCHSVNPGDNRLGPSLHGVVGRKAGSVEGYAYSPAFQTTSTVWTEENLDRFIENPNSVFPGSNMATFAGLTSPEDRKRIVDYMKTLK